MHYSDDKILENKTKAMSLVRTYINKVVEPLQAVLQGGFKVKANETLYSKTMRSLELVVDKNKGTDKSLRQPIFKVLNRYLILSVSANYWVAQSGTCAYRKDVKIWYIPSLAKGEVIFSPLDILTLNQMKEFSTELERLELQLSELRNRESYLRAKLGKS